MARLADIFNSVSIPGTPPNRVAEETQCAWEDCHGLSWRYCIQLVAPATLLRVIYSEPDLPSSPVRDEPLLWEHEAEGG